MMIEIDTKTRISDESVILWSEKEIPKLKLIIYKISPYPPQNSRVLQPLVTGPLPPDLSF